MKKSWFLYISLIILLLFSLTLPIYKEKSSDIALAEKSIEKVTKKWAEGTWEFISDAAQTIKNRFIKEEDVKPRSTYEKLEEQLFTGYGYGISPLGGTEKLFLSLRYRTFDTTSALNGMIVFITLIQIVLLNYFYKRKNPILGFINILISLALFGVTISNDKYNVLLFGSLIFIGIQIIYMILTKHRIPKKSSVKL